MRVLSLFDGMSTGQVALERAGIPVTEYYSSEIDKWAIQISDKNYPNTIQLGDIENIDPLKIPHIDIILCGSPCQGFSQAGLQKGFDDPRSRLWWKAQKIIRTLYIRNPNLKYLVENVVMRQEWIDVISESLEGGPPVKINSSLVSAQSRNRLYWSNIPIEQPSDRKIYLHDILDDGVTDREKAYCLDSCYYKSGRGSLRNYFEKSRRQLVFGCEDEPIRIGTALDIKGHDMLKRVYHPLGKSPTLTTLTGGNQHKKVAVTPTHYRKLSPLECERLQTMPEGYTEGVSDTQRYKMLGNGWTADVIAHILGGVS
jgi:site-specific DNA-cytosine methylase